MKLGIRDYIRSIQRGLGDSRLKDSFNGLLLGGLETVYDEAAFSFDNLSHAKDMALIGLWFMLRESELAGARASDLRLDGREVCLCIPIHKTDQRGRFTERSLTCSCSTRRHTMCVWHAAERHLIRLEPYLSNCTRAHLPLFPDSEGRTTSKQIFVEAIRKVIAATGTSLTRPGPDGQNSQRFHGHALRISGAQMLSSSGVELALIQLLGRWTSTAVLRYTQDSAMNRVTQIPQQILAEDQSNLQKVQLQVVDTTPAQAASSAQTKSAPPAARPKALAAAVRGIQAEFEQLKQAILQPAQTYVFRPKARILHLASKVEDSNEPTKWRTPCGWNYGSRTFLRTANESDGARKCRKCFNLGDSSSSDSGQGSSSLSDFADSSASSAERD